MRRSAVFGLVAALPMLACTAPHAQSLPSSAQPLDKFHVTEKEKAACASDAVRLCMHTYPDEDRLLSCMKENRGALTETCRVAFDTGVKRRGL